MRTCILISCLFFTTAVTAQVSVTMQHNDLWRTGLNPNETILNTSNVNQTLFGKLFTRFVDDQVFAQPLVVCNVVLPSVGKKNIVYVATVNNTVYAYDADNAAVTLPYWVDSLTPKGTVAVNRYDEGSACGGDFNVFPDNIGIVSTPAIDTNTHTIFVVTSDVTLPDSAFEHWVHAIDMRTGKEKSYSPVLIKAKYKGDGLGSINDTLTFDDQIQLQRSALTLINGVVYFSFASYCGWNNYHGWLMGYDTGTLRQKYLWMDTPDGWGGGIWMGGQGISSDSTGSLYFSTGNAFPDATGLIFDTLNLGESDVKLTATADSLKLTTFFTPYDWAHLDTGDLDLATCGLLLVPNTNWAFGGGKQGVMYLTDRNAMGGVGSFNQNLETFTIHGDSDYDFWENGIYGSPVYWKNDTSEYVYVWPCMTHLFAYKVNRALNQIDSDAVMQSLAISPRYAIPTGGMLSISADATAVGTGIVWASAPISDKNDVDTATFSGILRAYDATNLNNLLWTSQQDSVRDSVGRMAKFSCPTIANGKVYLNTWSNQLAVYGLLSTTGLPQPLPQNIISLYPDPAKDMVYYTTQYSISYIQIDDLLGRTVKTYTNTTQQTLDVSTLSAGTYLVKFFNANSITVKKLVVVK